MNQTNLTTASSRSYIAGWICSGISATLCLIFGPLLLLFAVPLALAGFILSIVNLSKGANTKGIILLIGSIGAPVIGFLIWLVFTTLLFAGVASSMSSY